MYLFTALNVSCRQLSATVYLPKITTKKNSFLEKAKEMERSSWMLFIQKIIEISLMKK